MNNLSERMKDALWHFSCGPTVRATSKCQTMQALVSRGLVAREQTIRYAWTPFTQYRITDKGLNVLRTLSGEVEE